MATVERRIAALEQARGDGRCIVCTLVRISAQAEGRDGDEPAKCTHGSVSLLDVIRSAGRLAAQEAVDGAC